MVHKNVFWDYVKHVARQGYHIAQWHDGLKRSGKAEMPSRTTSVQDDLRGEQHSATHCFPLDADRRLAACELAAEAGVCHKTVFHILHDILGYRKLAARWICHEISKVHRYAAAQTLLDRYQWEGDDFLG